MACSIESRVPLLDHTFVEFAARVPDHLKVRGSSGKYILKEAVKDIIPADVIHRKKLGFPTPLRQWLLDERATQLFANLNAKDGFLSEYLNMDEIGRLLARHQSGEIDATDRIWRLINLQVWGESVLGGRDMSDGLLHSTQKACIAS